MVENVNRRVTIYEVGPRDGLQNEATPIPTDAKVTFVNALADAGLTWIETTSFVNPKAVPQLADATEVMQAIDRRPGVRYPVLVPNERGMERALAAGIDAIALFAAASETFSQANIRASIDESFERFKTVVEIAKRERVWIRGYVSTAFHCPYSGPVIPAQAVAIAERLFALGCDEVAIADTIGRATPEDTRRLLDVAIPALPVEQLAFHLHDTAGLALDNIRLALDAGITILDGSAGGLGGCPFAPGAPGNLATEALVRMLDEMGFETGVDADAVESAATSMRALL
ncbi:MAG TPA: hydroxymethylglutaryl-CoA lyase [Thermomicrobiales bacterium]|nr:hydroxymethylglutaryl-CoA lyase [Thermomicrobiales bacterium]